MMESPRKRPKLHKSLSENVWLRLCDSFIRTDGNLICPIIKAETSIRVLFKLQGKVFGNILRKCYQATGLKTQMIEWNNVTSIEDMQQNLFIQCVSSTVIDEPKLKYYKETLTSLLRSESKVKNVLIDRVDDTMEMIHQPIISEPDFEMHKLELSYKALSDIQADLEVKDAINVIMENIKQNLDEYKEHRTKIAVLSQNGKGKSFFLNLLFLMTSDNEEEYIENNKNLKLPKDIAGNLTVGEVEENVNDLPDVVTDFIKTYQSKQENFKTLMETHWHELQPAKPHAVQVSKKSFLSIPRYFTEGRRIESEPFILAQKNLDISYESTTKCIIHLRYGTVYQLKVDYFGSEDLKQQLFELVSLTRNDKAKTNKSGINHNLQNKSCECLQTRFALLTDYDISDTNEDVLKNFRTYGDIVLSKEVKKFAGKTEMYIGSGKNSAAERLALKDILRGLTSAQNSNCNADSWKHRVAAVKKIVVYLPSKILYGGKEILEMPGTDDSDPLAMDFIQKALNTVDGIFVMSEFAFKIAEKEVKEILANSEFMQQWKKFPTCYSLMFLAYPEKDVQFQFKIEDKEIIKSLEGSEKGKRLTELKELSKLIDMKSLSQAMDEAIFTSYVLPVLHTSIHGQEGMPHQVISEHADFLKFTGIKKLMTHLDTFISSMRIEHFNQVIKQLTQNMEGRGLTANVARSLIDGYQNKDVRDIRTNTLCVENNKFMSNLKTQLEILYRNTFQRMMEGMLTEAVVEAKQSWELHEEDITALGAFNPYFCGNHSAYKVKISNITFKDFEGLKSKVFEFLRKEIASLLKQFKGNSTELLTKELNSVLQVKGIKHLDANDFVKQSIKCELHEALQWYIGRQQMAISKTTIGRLLEESKRLSLKRNMLVPAYNKHDLDLAKQMAKLNIDQAVMGIKDDFILQLLKLHDRRWKSFSTHIKANNGMPKMWQVLFGKLKRLSQTTDGQAQPDELSEVLKLISAKLPK